MKPSSILLSLWTAALVVAAPTATVEKRDPYQWTPTLAAFYEMVAQHIQEARSESSFPNPPSCDLSKAVMPVAPTPLPSPDGLRLAHVAVGRGVQNYTCSSASADVVPVAIGAVANLYNASCLAANYPDLLQLLPNLALQRPVPSAGSTTLSPSSIMLSGHHFFTTSTTPVFDLTANPQWNVGVAVGKKSANSTAPAGSLRGLNGQGNGVVPWLYLTATDASIGGFKSIYRVNTAGGAAPKTCAGINGVISVDYASVYWFYKG